MGKTIICVDDEPLVLESLSGQLKPYLRNKANLEMVGSGQEVLDLIDELTAEGEEIPLVISDQIMPKMNGDELLVKVHSKLPLTYNVLLTGRANDAELLSLINEASLYRYIPKPWEETDLFLTVSEALTAYDRESDLARKNKELFDLNSNLENKVRERTSQLDSKTIELEKTIEELQTTQHKLVQNEKLASLGQLMAGIAHEINTPLGAINASVGTLHESFWHCLNSFKGVMSSLSSKEISIFFQMVKQGGIQSSYLSSKESRMKRRELEGILSNWEFNDYRQLADRLVDMNITSDLDQYRSILKHDKQELIISSAYNLINQIKCTNNIEVGVKKANKIVYALKSYSRFSQAEEQTEIDLSENIETVLVLYNNQMHGVEVVRNFGAQSIIVNGYPDELIQVWTNIIHNSIQAMNGKGKLTICIMENTNNVEVLFGDDGPGIPIEIQPNIFDTFFTTKQRGEGSGLGLDIAKKVVEKHHGSIGFESTTDGTKFSVTLPR